jgi:cytoskeletal protein CcmA (bactofilin family)
MLKLLKMFNWKQISGAKITIGDAPATLIGEKIILDVNSLTGSESLRVDGMVKGNINLESSFTVGEPGSITGNIKANSVIIAGSVVGNITSETIVHITSTAKIVGNIEALNIIVDEGAKLKGTYRIGDLEKDFQFNPISRFGIQEN